MQRQGASKEPSGRGIALGKKFCVVTKPELADILYLIDIPVLLFYCCSQAQAVLSSWIIYPLQELFHLANTELFYRCKNFVGYSQLSLMNDSFTFTGV